MEEIISAGKLGEAQEIPFNNLEFLELHHVPELKSIYWSALGFQHLKELLYTDAQSLRGFRLISPAQRNVKLLLRETKTGGMS